MTHRNTSQVLNKLKFSEVRNFFREQKFPVPITSGYLTGKINKTYFGPKERTYKAERLMLAVYLRTTACELLRLADYLQNGKKDA